jgi:hypothetical protein
VFRGAAQMPEREGRNFFFCLQTMLAVLFLISGALTIEAAFGGYPIGLLFVAVMADGVLFS